MKPPPAYLSLPKAAKRFGTSHPTLWRMVVSGTIPKEFVLRSGRKRPRIYLSTAFFESSKGVA